MDAEKIKTSAASTASGAGKRASEAVNATAPVVSRGFTALLERLIENRGFRVAVIGAAFVLIGLQLGSDSAWTLPVFVVGAALILAGALGTRLSGKLAIEWGEEGATFEMRARVAPPEPVKQLELTALESPSTEDAVIESTGETIEMDLVQLREMLPTSKNSKAATERVAS
ncbi:hypothetical protein BH10ACT11_BH10ACT11_17880 [soil metagenome]